MAVRENVTLNNVILSLDAEIVSSTTTNGAIIDTADQDIGVSFYLALPAWTDGTYKIALEEGNDSALSDTAAVPAAKLVLVDGLDAVTDGLGAASAAGTKYVKVGVHSTKRYVRANIVSTGVSSGAFVNLIALVSPETIEAN